MKQFVFAYVICASLITISATPATTTQSTDETITGEIAAQQNSPHIRVLLAEYSLTTPKEFSLGAETGLRLKSSLLAEKAILFLQPELHVRCTAQGLYLSAKDKKYRKLNTLSMVIMPRSTGPITFDGKQFQGTLTLMVDQEAQKAFLINSIDIEAYVYAVLRYESFQTWPLEMHKIQAIASRSYALHLLEKNRHRAKPLPYDIKRTNINQTYHGTHTFTHLREAVDSTRHMILSHKDTPALAMFDICCGGLTPAHMKGYDFTSAPYLARTAACTYCKGTKLFSWQHRLTTEKFTLFLQNNPKVGSKVAAIAPVREIKITNKDRAGMVKKLVLKGRHNNVVEISGDHCYSSMSHLIRSLNFKVSPVGKNEIVIAGKGFGHCAGLCQYGARELVRRGWNYKQVLSFYYPKTTLAKVC